MNFDFIRELDGLNLAFDSCSNAEELAIAMPDLSMIASRKSAEVLAKFVYLVSHAAEAEDLSFADILSNDIVLVGINLSKTSLAYSLLFLSSSEKFIILPLPLLVKQ